MAEPTSITTNSAGIYSADLLYEQNCKCGTTVVLAGGQDWSAGAGDRVWRIDVISNGDATGRPAAVFSALSATNMAASSLLNLARAKYVNTQTIMGDFFAIETEEVDAITLILYKDCTQS